MLLLDWTPQFPALHTLVNQLCNQLAAANNPESISSDLRLSLTSTLVTNLMTMRYNELSNMTVLWQNEWMLELFAERRTFVSHQHATCPLSRMDLTGRVYLKREDFLLLSAT